MKTTYPAPGILDGITTASESRKKLWAVKANVNDDSVIVYATVDGDTASSIFLGWADPNDTTSPNRFDMQAEDGVGVYLHKRVNGTWTTVPQAVSIGGTGATSAADALKNLGATIKINAQQFSDISINANAGLATVTAAAKTISGYTPVAIAGFQMSALSVVPVSCYLDGTNIKYALRNITSNAVSGITFTVRVLYVHSGMKL